jgi:hypothetical protein
MRWLQRLFPLVISFKYTHDHYYHTSEGTAERLRRLSQMLSVILDNQESIMIDTSKIIASVAAEKTKVDSLIALANGQSATMKDLSKQLADAIAANDPAAMAQVQADLDKAASDLDTETASVTAAIDANTVQPNPAP